jgi:hypothetical protein
MVTTRSKTKYERIKAITYGNWLIEELDRLPMTEIKEISQYLMEFISTQALWWRVIYEPSFRNKLHAHCETYVTAFESERNITDMKIWQTATTTELLKHRANIILKDMAKWI